MRASHRKAILFTILVAVVALILVDPVPNRNAKSSVAPASPQRHGQDDGGAPAPGAKGAAKALAPALPERPALGEPRSELFGAHSWQPPAAKVATARVAPSVPPMPYRFAGKLIQNGQLQVFLSKGDTPIPIKQGEILDGAYRVESISEGGVTLVYLALGHKENIPIGRAFLPATTTAPPSGVAPPAGGTQAGIGTIPTGSVLPAVTTPFPLSRRDGVTSGVAEPKAQSKPARLLWDGPQQVKLGASFSVALRVISDQPLRASPMQVRFDPTVLESVAVRPGKFFGAEEERGFSYRVNSDGSIFVGASAPGTTSVADGELLVLTFKPIKPGAVAEVSVASLGLQGAAGHAIAHDALAAFKTAIIP